MESITISYAITVADEYQEIQRLLTQLIDSIDPEDEIIVLCDLTKNTDPDNCPTLKYLLELDFTGKIKVTPDKFDGDFATWKNKLNRLCSKDYIFQIDADEILAEHLLKNIKQLLKQNSGIELLAVPRVNTVAGITQQHIQQWRWNQNPTNGWINFPDYQTRIYKRDPDIRWEGKVHETVVGFGAYAFLPAEEEWALQHPKTIERQERQNNYYNTL
jgi:mannose/fructose-specific phosphotransferase system component IIA